MIETLSATIGVAVFGALWWKERLARRQKLKLVSSWLQEALAGKPLTGQVAEDDGEMLAVADDVARLARHVESVQRDQSAEQANLQTILVSMAEGVMVVDARHFIRLANPSLTRIFELKTTPVGRSVLEAVREVNVEEIVTRTLRDQTPQQMELSIAHTKPPRQLAITATPMQDAAGEKAVLLICHDITRLKQLEDVRREFVANVSHELRTPLAIFQGYLETLLDFPDRPQEDLIEVFEILRKHSNRLNLLVEDLLVLARLESRADILCLEPIEPQSLISEIVADWRIQAAKKNIELTGECEEDAPIFEADGLRLEQVLNNLIDNAVKYTNRGGKVQIKARPFADGIEISVSDSGVGIPPQDLVHVFERFYRADKARSREHGGTGLGLSIVKHIVQKHGGTVHAESVYGQGTTIVLRLPARGTVPAESVSQPGGKLEQGVNGYEHAA